MKSETGRRIKKKRIQRRRHLLRKILRIIVICIFGAVAGWFIYQLYNIGTAAYNNYQESYQGYKKRTEQRRAEADEHFDGYTNVLVMGIDEGTTGKPGKHADALLLLSFDNAKGTLRVLSVPRGTLVTLPGQKVPQRISDVYAAGGAQLVTRKIIELLGVSVHQYVAIDTKALTEMIDILGGIDLYVEENMHYEDPEVKLKIDIQKGFQHLDGEKAQQYLRYRGDELGDIGRVKRQQKFVAAFYKKVLSLDAVTKVPQLKELFEKRVVTSAEIFDSAHLISVIKGLSGEMPPAVLLPGVPKNGDDTVWQVNEPEMKAKIAEMFPVLGGEQGGKK